MSLELDKPCTMRDRTYRHATTLALYPVGTRVGPECPASSVFPRLLRHLAAVLTSAVWGTPSVPKSHLAMTLMF
jgi:hypothetical protein